MPDWQITLLGTILGGLIAATGGMRVASYTLRQQRKHEAKTLANLLIAELMEMGRVLDSHVKSAKENFALGRAIAWLALRRL